jgi:glycosyltransferase involved in cell wall biosynthesis
VVAPAGQRFPPVDGYPDGIRVHEVAFVPREGMRPAVRWTDEALPGILDEIDPDVHLGPTFALPPSHARAQVVTLHDTMFERFPQFYGESTREFLRGQSLRALRDADVAIAVSEATRSDVIADWQPQIPVRVTPLAPHGVLPPVASGLEAPTQETPARRPIHEPYVLNVGGSHRRKRLDVLIDAFARVVADRSGDAPSAAADHGDLHLVVIGVAGDDHVQERVAASPARDRIILTGRVSDEELAAWYAHAELFAYPSEYEGFGLTPLEAMAAGAPVLTYENSALADNLRGAAAFVGPGADALADGMSRLLADLAERDRLRTLGRERAAGFTWERTAAATVAVLEEAVAAFGSRSGIEAGGPAGTEGVSGT